MKILTNIQRFNVDLSEEMLKELDIAAQAMGLERELFVGAWLRSELEKRMKVRRKAREALIKMGGIVSGLKAPSRRR